MNSTISDNDLIKKSVEYRKKILTYIKKANGGHTGGSLSCIDILNVLYNDILNISPDTFNDPNRDRYIQSKGHSVEALYVVLADCGFYPETDLGTMSKYQSHFVGHPTRKIPGIEQNTGALGHGLSISAGIAMAGKKDKAHYRVFTLLGDGELTEGSNWEALLFAAHYQLDNLVAIVDHNRLQITGPTNNVLNTDPLIDKFEAFGWSVKIVNGNDIPVLRKTLSNLPFEKGKPTMIIAETIKGKGISFMEDNYKWHHKVPDDEQFKMALAELEKQLNVEY